MLKVFFFSRVTLNKVKIKKSVLIYQRYFKSAIQNPNRTITTSNKVSLDKLKTALKCSTNLKFLVLFGLTGLMGFKIYKETNPLKQLPKSDCFKNGRKKKTLVILGTGWGSISLLKKIDASSYNIVLVSPRNHFLYTPLLPSCATGTVDSKSIIESIKYITKKKNSYVDYIEGEATDIDPSEKKITIKQTNSNTFKKNDRTSDKFCNDSKTTNDSMLSLSYDYLVVGIGAESSTFGISGASDNSIFLREISDTVKIKSKLISLMEKANCMSKTDPERSKLLNIVICGGGPSGVEFAGELYDYIEHDLKKWMPETANELRIVLIEALPNVLGMFNSTLVSYTNNLLHSMNIDLRTNTVVKKVKNDYVIAQSKSTNPGEVYEIPYGMLIWTAGLAPRSLTKKISTLFSEQINSKRGLSVDDNLKVNGSNDIYALGDCTSTKYFSTAQVATQQGKYLASYFEKLNEIDLLDYEINDNDKDYKTQKQKIQTLKKNIPTFKYDHSGVLAYIGSGKAVVNFVWKNVINYSFAGSTANLLWKFTYLKICTTMRNRFFIFTDWVKSSIFGRDISGN